ncbi:putative phytanoyl-CoA dioxygenase [Helianthus anomalus]
MDNINVSILMIMDNLNVNIAFLMYSGCNIMFVVATLHCHDYFFKKVSCSDKMSGTLHSMGYKRPVIVQSINQGLAMKLSLIKIFHLCTLALAYATVVNGCLWAIPGNRKGCFFFIFFKTFGYISNIFLF